MPDITEFKKNDKLHPKAMPSCRCEHRTGGSGPDFYLLLSFGKPTKAGPYGAFQGQVNVSMRASEAAELVRIIKDAFPDLEDHQPFDVRRN